MAHATPAFDFDAPTVHFERHVASPTPSGDVRLFFERLPSGSTFLPRFAILNECEFVNPRTGETVTIDERRLHKLANTLNQKFSKTGQAVPIVPGHTVDGVPESQQPEIIGYGVSAEVEDQINPINGERVLDEKTGKPVKAIYLTPISLPDKADTFRRLNRRSPELWLDPDDIDPLSLLGANTPRRNLGPHLFSRKGEEAINDSTEQGSTTKENAMAIDDKGPKTDEIAGATGNGAPPPSPAGAAGAPDLGQGGGEDPSMDPTAVKVFELLKQSDEWKEMTATIDRLGQLAQVMEEQFGGEMGGGPGGMGGAPGAPGAMAAPGGAPEMGGAPPGGAPPEGGPGQNPLFQEEEEQPAGGPPEKMAAACGTCGKSPCVCKGDDKSGHQKSQFPPNPGDKEKMMAFSPAGPTNTSVPGYEKFARQYGYVPATPPLPTPSTQVSATMDDQNMPVRMARLERDFAASQRENAAKDERIKLLEQVNLANEIENELRNIADKGVMFDPERERQTLIKMSKKEDREAHYQYMETFFVKKKDVPPGGIPVPATKQAPLQFARGLQQEVPGAAQMSNDDATRIAEETARRVYGGGEKVSASQVWQEELARRNGTAGGMTQVR